MYQDCRNKIGVNGVVVWEKKLNSSRSHVLYTTSNLVNSRRWLTRTAKKCTKMQNPRAGRAELLFLLITPIVLWRSRSCCRRACVSFYQRKLSSNNPEARFSKVPKSHSRNFDPLILKSWSFYVLSGELKLVCGRSFVPWDAVVLKMQTWSTPEKFRDFRETGPMAELFEFR